MSYDVKCEELARHFLPSDISEHRIKSLAQRIQDFVDDELADVREAYSLLTPKHIHKAKYSDDGKLLDECASCGHDLRDTDVHLTAIR